MHLTGVGLICVMFRLGSVVGFPTCSQDQQFYNSGISSSIGFTQYQQFPANGLGPEVGGQAKDERCQ